MSNIGLRFHNRSSREGEVSSIEADLANEMRTIVMKAAEPVPAGENIKGQMSRSWEALGRPAWWRLKAAWQGYAGAWRGTAHQDFRNRDAERRRKVEAGRAKASELGQLFAGVAERLRTIDADFHCDDIARFERLAREMGAETSARTEAKDA